MISTSTITQTGKNTTARKSNRVLLRESLTGYGASLAMTGVMVPFVASVTMVAIYLALPNAFIPLPLLNIGPDSKWYAIAASTIFTILLWLIAALACLRFATAEGAHPRSYGLLKSRLCQLKANLGIDDSDDELKALEEKYGDIKVAVEKIKDLQSKNVEGGTCASNQVAQTDAYACYIDIRKMLQQYPAGVLWTSGTGYNNAWSLLHHAEEALIEWENVPELIRGAIHDKLAIQGSAISSKDELLDKLARAVTTLDPLAVAYLKDHQSKESSELDQLAEAFKQKAIKQIMSENGLDDDASKGVDPKAKLMARVALREVRSTLNSFRDKSWEGIVRARNKLLASIAVTGTVTHILLSITILTSQMPNAVHPASALMAATAFYLIGAVTGLFGRFYHESIASNAIDDFGFSIARLIATPLLSGLAGIGGVLFTVMFAALGGPAAGGMVTLGNIFNLDPKLFLAAAIFGLTPNLLIKGLQEKGRKYESDIESSKAAEPAVTNAKV